MMTKILRLLPFWLSLAAAFAFLPAATTVRAQSTPGSPAAAKTNSAKPNQIAPAIAAPAASAPVEAAPLPDRAQAYYHLALAGVYEDDAISDGRTDEVNKAIEEYKLALNADPDSAALADDLADLYFRVGRVHDAEVTARMLLKSSPDNIDAHKLLGRIYLRQLGEGEQANAGATAPGNSQGNSQNQVLDEAIAEF